MDNVLVKDSEKYSGKYVALRSFQDRHVVTSGKDPGVVHARAISKGIEDPVVFFVPQKDMVHIY